VAPKTQRIFGFATASMTPLVLVGSYSASSWRRPAESCKKMAPANKFIHNLEYKQDVKKRRETCKL
jgi:hypothetical protein